MVETVQVLTVNVTVKVVGSNGCAISLERKRQITAHTAKKHASQILVVTNMLDEALYRRQRLGDLTRIYQACWPNSHEAKPIEPSKIPSWC